MGNVALDIINVDDLPPKKSKQLNKILLIVLIPLIGAAFTYGGIRVSKSNKITNIEKSIVSTNQRVDLVVDEIDLFKENVHLLLNQYQDFNNKQLNLIIDYHNTEPDLLKKMIELNSIAFFLESKKDSINPKVK